jgi:hypothetical protein
MKQPDRTLHDLNAGAWTMAALAACAEAGLIDRLREPRRVQELAAA